MREGDLERVTGIEPVTKAWEAAVIPFHHTRRTFWILSPLSVVKGA